MSFEFDLNGTKVYTGCQMPETYPLSFKPYPEVLVRPLDEIAEIIRHPARVKSRVKWGPDKLINQKSLSSCNAAMAAAMLQRAIYNFTGVWKTLAWEWLYANINGGQDNGSMLDDGMKFVTDFGIPNLFVDNKRMVPAGTYRLNSLNMETQRYCKEDAINQRFLECYQFPNDSIEKLCHAMLSCIAGRGVAGVAVHVGGSYMRSGVVAGFDRGPGNHAVCVDDITVLTDKPKSIEDFRFVSPQSWGTGFADGGFTELTFKHFVEPMRYHGLYGCRSVAASLDDVSDTRILV